MNTADLSPIIFYYYFDLADTEAFCDLLRRRFVESGHDRPIEFRSWDCYDTPPARDGDVYCYDALVLSTLADEGYIRVLPDIIDTSRVFPWILDRSRIRNKIYGIPMMTCANVLICREADRIPARSIYELPEGLAAPMKSMAMTYYLYALCNLQDRKEEGVETLRQIQRIIGEEAYATSKFAVYDGIARFRRGDCRYLIGFTEDIRNLDPDRYTVSLVNFSNRPVNEMPLLPTDFVSLGTNIDTEKLLDCLDLMEIMADSDFVYDLCTTGGKLQYMLPADMSVYPRLEQLDPIYTQFYAIAGNADNGILRFGKHFYTDYLQKEAELLQLLEAELGCDCGELRPAHSPEAAPEMPDAARFDELKRYIEENYVPAASEDAPARRHTPPLGRKKTAMRRDTPAEEEALCDSACFGQAMAAAPAAESSLAELLRQSESTFSEFLLDLLRERDGKDSEVYHRAEISKQLFSKILSTPDYRPTKSTAIQLAIGLQLDLDQTQKLLEKAGYALTRSSKADLVVQYYIERRVYSVSFINEALADCGLPLLKTGLRS